VKKYREEMSPPKYQTLDQLQLSEPAEYLLHLVSFLVGAGAEKIEVFSSRSALRVEATGVEVDPKTVNNPFSVLLKSGHEPHLSEFALGLNTLLGLKSGRADLRVGELKARYTSQLVEVENVGEVARGLILVTGPRVGGGERELELLTREFRWSPIPVKVNGQSLPGPQVRASRSALEVFLHNPEYPLTVGEARCKRITKLVHAGFSALVRVAHLRRSCFRVIHLGRCYEQALPWEFFLPGWEVDVTVNSDRFQKDLSQQNILAKDVYLNLADSLRQQLELAVDSLLTEFPPAAGSEELVNDLIDMIYSRGEREVAIQLQGRLRQSLALTDRGLEKGRAQLRYALMKKNGGAEEAAREISLAVEMLSDKAAGDPLEPEWSILKGNMTFAVPDNGLLNQVRAQILIQDLPDHIKEMCLRWLLRHDDQPIFRGNHRINLARLCFDCGRLAEAEKLIFPEEPRAKDDLEAAAPPWHSKELELKGELLARKGMVDKSVEMFARHLSLLRQEHGQYSLNLGLTLERLSTLLEFLGQKARAREYRSWSRRLHRS